MAKDNKARRHGMKDSAIYRIWTSMKGRCQNPNSEAYDNYGGRGITVCERWLKFENFYADMGEPPAGLTLDRIDNDGPYSPENCRWATRKEQRLNQRGMRLLEHDGRALSIADWAEVSGVPPSTLGGRLARGFDIARAMSKVEAA